MCLAGMTDCLLLFGCHQDRCLLTHLCPHNVLHLQDGLCYLAACEPVGWNLSSAVEASTIKDIPAEDLQKAQEAKREAQAPPSPPAGAAAVRSFPEAMHTGSVFAGPVLHCCILALLLLS